MEPKIIYEDECLLVLDKPAGWIVNEAETTKTMPVIQIWLKKKFDYQLAKSREERSGIVHRLDKETSGVLVVAKTQDAFENLQKQFKSRIVTKSYIALVHGKVEPKSGEIRMPVGRLPWNRERFGVLPGGRDAATSYKVIKYFFPTANYRRSLTLLEICPKTGRTHQIRIHLKYIGHPVVSDSFYAGRRTAREDHRWCPRLFLHAEKISFKHPQSGENVTFKSNLPTELREVLASLEKHPQTP